MNNKILHSAVLPAILFSATALSGCSTFRPPQIEYDEPPIEATLRATRSARVSTT